MKDSLENLELYLTDINRNSYFLNIIIRNAMKDQISGTNETQAQKSISDQLIEEDEEESAVADETILKQ